MKLIPVLLIITYTPRSMAYGYDSGNDHATCGKSFRSGRQYRAPCDLGQGYCTTAGISYPWHAVRRFVRENQGLMKRMYGDQRHIAVLQAELESNTFYEPYEYYQYYSTPKQENSARLLHDDPKLGEILNAKFIYSESINFKPKLTVPYFRIKEKINATTESNLVTTETFGTTGTIEEITIETENITTSIDTTATTEIVTLKPNVTQENVTDSIQKKETAGEILFQDTEEPSKKVQVNSKLKGVNACPVKEEVVAPFWANNTRGEVLALLNLYPFEQYVHWEKCTFEHRQMYCREGCRCEQQYRLHRLLAYDPNNECRGIFSDWFRFPSCCICKCYNIPADFRVTSRSPRNSDSENDINDMPDWFVNKQNNLNDA